MTLVDALERTRRDRAVVEALIADPRRLGPDFAPVRSVGSGELVAVKATGRGEAGTDLADTLALLQAAQGLGLVERLDWAFRCLAFDVALEGGLTAELHLTPEPETFGTSCPPRLAVAFGRGRRGLRVGAELHAQAFRDPAAVRSAVAEWHDWGWGVVLADVADEPAGMAALADLRPAYVQVDLSLPGRAEPSAPVRRLLDAARDAGAQVMAVRVDSAAARAAATALGVDCWRGAGIGAPGPLPTR